MMIKVPDQEGKSFGWLDAMSIRSILPAEDGNAAALPKEQEGIPIVGRGKPEIVGSIIFFHGGGNPVATSLMPEELAQLINDAKEFLARCHAEPARYTGGAMGVAALEQHGAPYRAASADRRDR